jgi:formylglycine-generating enzyme required for sulfatase activity
MFAKSPLCLTLPLLLTLAAALAQPRADQHSPILRRFVDEFVTLTPGHGQFPASFSMGSADKDNTEKPVHTVAFKHPFAMARYEVTQELYEAIEGKNPSRWKGPRNSVELVHWQEANEFCRKLTAELRSRKLLAADEVIRLPTEAEWEYACRAGTTTAYCFGEADDLLKDFAWYKGNSKGEDPPVGKKKPNAWGLYDMHGYVWEWCLDAWHASYTGAPSDGGAWEMPGAKERVARGGSWADDADHARAAFRHRFPADHRSDTVGLRCVKGKEKTGNAP